MKKVAVCLAVGMLLSVPMVSFAENDSNENPIIESNMVQMQEVSFASDEQIEEIKADTLDELSSGAPNIKQLLLNGNAGVAFVNEKNTIEADVTYTGKNLKYKYVYSYNNWSDWGVISPLSNNKSVQWIPKRVGSYEIYVDVEDEQGRITTKVFKVNVDKSWVYSDINVNDNCKIGYRYIVSPVVENAGSDLEYKFVYSYDNWNDWGVIQDFSTKSTAYFVPQKMGTYEIYVDIKDKNGIIESKAVKTEAGYGWNFTGISGSAKITFGQSSIFNAVTEGETDGLKYKFVYSYDNWSDWGVIKEAGDDSSVSFEPKKPGKYDIYVDVIDSKGNVITKSINLEVLADWSFTDIALSSSNADPGDTISIKPEVTGNTGGLKYKFVYSYLDWHKWGVIHEPSEIDSVDFKVESAGYYDIYVDITDDTGYTVSKNIRVTSAGGNIPVLNQDWYSVVNKALPKNGIYTVVDVGTGKRFNVKRWAGDSHADVEPLTQNDTNILKEIYGGNLSWNRRPVIVINKDKAYAGSVVGVPHGTATIANNGFSGHICIHFLNSKTHGSNNVDPDHQKQIKTAAAVGSIKL